MVDSMSVRFKNASVSKKCLQTFVYSRMREPLACRSASAKNAMACRGLRVGPSKFGNDTVAVAMRLVIASRSHSLGKPLPLKQVKKSIHHHRGTPPLSVCRPTPRLESQKKLWCTPFPW